MMSHWWRLKSPGKIPTARGPAERVTGAEILQRRGPKSKPKKTLAKPLESSKDAVRMDWWENMRRNRARNHEKYRSFRTKYSI
jgi:hypothetical protein